MARVTLMSSEAYVSVATLDAMPSGSTCRLTAANATSVGLPSSAEVITFENTATRGCQVALAHTNRPVWIRTHSGAGWGAWIHRG